MQKNNKVIRLTEAQLQQVILESAQKMIEEGRFGDMAKKVGKGVAKGVAGAALMGACTAGALKGLDNNIKYQDRLNHEAAAMSCDPVKDYMETHHCSYEDAKNAVGDVDGEEYYNETHPMANESKKMPKMTTKMLESVVRKSLKKILA